MTDTKELRRLAEAATPGPWVAFDKPKYKEWHVSVPISDSTMKLALFADGCQTERPMEDCQFIAAANPRAIIELCNALDAATAEIERLTVIENAAKNLIAVKGRHNAEIAYNRLAASLSTKGAAP